MWNIFLIMLGKMLGNHWHQIIVYVGMYSKVFIVIIAIAVLYVLYLWYKRIKETRVN
ncbi:hypothetical protein ABKP99_08870 [Mammaliicoccus sciuri]